MKKFENYFSSYLSPGFDVQWTQTPGPAQGCGGSPIKVTSTPTTIISPIDKNTGEYFPNLACDWWFHSDASIKFTFKSFDLEEREEEVFYHCFDYVEIIDGPHLSDRVLYGPQCGKQSPFIVKVGIFFRFSILINNNF